MQIARRAKVSVVVGDLKEPCGKYFNSTLEMSTDLPADALGVVVAAAINKAWKAGVDPINMQVTVYLR